MHHSNNYNINLNMLKMRGSFLGKFKTKSGADRKCLVIPLDQFIYVDEVNQKAMLGLVAIQRRHEGDDTHFVQVRVNPNTINDEHKPPILGHLSKMRARDADHDEDEYVTEDK